MELRDHDGKRLYLGSFVKILSLGLCPFEDPEEEKLFYAAKGMYAQLLGLIDSHEIVTEDGDVFVKYIHLTNIGTQSIKFYVKPDQVRRVQAREELLLLYSNELWQLIAPYGETQTSASFNKIRDFLKE